MIFRKLLISLFFTSLVLACTQRDGDYNQHSETPAVSEGKVDQKSQSFYEAAQALENHRGSAFNEINNFFKKYLTEDFLFVIPSRKILIS